MTTAIALIYSPHTKSTLAVICHENKLPRFYHRPTSSSIMRLNELVIKSRATIRPSLIGNIGWSAIINERSL